MFGEQINPALEQQQVMPPQPDWLMSASRGLDQLIGMTGIPSVTAGLGESIGGLFGMPEIGREMGQNLPRDVVNLAPAFLGPLGMATAAGLSGASAYERSGGNVGAGIIGGAMAPLAPLAAGVGGTLAKGAMGIPFQQGVGRIAATVPQRIGEMFGENIAGMGLGEIGGQLSSLATGQGLYNPLTPENMFQTVAGNVPFMLADLPRQFRPLAPKPEGPKPLASAEIQRLRRAVSARGQQQPSDRLFFNDDGNITITGLDGKPTTYTTLGEADDRLVMSLDPEAGVSLSLPPRGGGFGLPEDMLKALDDVKSEADATGKTQKLMAISLGLDPTVENMQKAMRAFLEPEEMKLLSSGMTPAEGLSRWLQKETSRKETAIDGKAFNEVADAIRQEYGITGRIDPVAVASKLNPDFAALADKITKTEFKEYATKDVSYLQRGRTTLENLLEKNRGNPEVAAALEQEIAMTNYQIAQATGQIKEGFNLQPEYDPAVASVLEGVLPEKMMTHGKARGEHKTKSLLEHTPYLYALLYEKQKAGIPAAEAEKQIKKSLVFSNALKKGWMPKEEVVRTTNQEEAERIANQLTQAEKDPSVRYDSKWDDKEKTFVVEKKANLFRSMIEGVDTGAPVDVQRALMEAEFRDMDVMEAQDEQDFQSRMENVRKGSKVTEGLELLSRLLVQRRRHILNGLTAEDFMADRARNPENLALAQRQLDHAKLLNELDANPEMFDPKDLPTMGWTKYLDQPGYISQMESTGAKIPPPKEGEVPVKVKMPKGYKGERAGRQYIEPANGVDEILRIAEAAGVPIEYGTASQKARDVNRYLESTYKRVLQAYDKDSVEKFLTGKIRSIFEAAPRIEAGHSYEYTVAKDRVEQFAKKAKFLHANIDMHVVQGLGDLKGFLIKEHGEEKGNALFGSFMGRTKGAGEGFYDRDNGNIIVVADNVEQRGSEAARGLGFEAAVDRVLWHEAAGHWGLEKVLGNEYTATLRRVLNSMPQDERARIAELYTGGDKNKLLVAAEYLAKMSETDPNVGLLQKFYGKLRYLAGRSGRDMNNLSDADMKLLVQRGRDHLFHREGFRMVGPADFDEPDSTMTGVMASIPEYFAPSGNPTGLPTAFDAAREGAINRGLEPTEADNQAYRAMGAIKSAEGAPDSYRLQGKEFVAGGQVPGTYITVKASKKPRENITNMIRGKTIYDSFQRSLSGEYNKTSPVLARRDEIATWASRTPMEVRESVLIGMAKAAGTEVGLREATKMSEMPDQFPTAIASMAANVINNKGAKGFEEIARYAPKPVAEMVRAMTKEMVEDARSGLGVRQAEELGITPNRAVSMEQKAALGEIFDLQNSIRKVDEESARAEKAAQNFQLWDPQYFDQLMFALPPTNRGTLLSARNMAASTVWKSIPREGFPKPPTLWERSMEIASNLAETYPEFYPFLRTARGYSAIAQNSINEALESFSYELQGGRLVHNPEGKHYQHVATRPALREAFNSLGLKQNEVLKQHNRKLDPTEINAVRSQHAGVSDADWQRTLITFEQATAAAGKLRETMLRDRAARISSNMLLLVGHNSQFAHMEDLMEFKVAMQKALYDPVANPLDTAYFTSKLGAPTVAQGVDFVYGTPLVGTARSLRDGYADFQIKLRQADGYLPEVRYGPYLLQYTRSADGKVATERAMNTEDIKTREAELYASGEANPGTVKYQRKADFRASNMDLTGQRTLERAMEIEDEAMEAALVRSMGQNAFDTYVKPFYDPLKESIRTEQEKTMGDYWKKRRLAPGREKLDFLDTLMSHVPAVSYGVSRSNVNQDAAFYLHDPRLAHNPQLRDLAKQEVQNTLRVPTSAEKTVREVPFQYFMALNLSTMAMEATQSLSTLVPWLTRHGAGFGGSYREWTKAVSTNTRAAMRGWNYDDPVLGAAVKRAEHEGVIDKGLMQEYEDPRSHLTDKLIDATALKKAQKGIVDVGKMYLQTTRNLYGTMAYFNNRLAFTSGWERGKAMGLTGEGLYDFATRTVNATMFAGGRANRSVGLHSAEGAVGGTLASAFGALQTYFMGMVGTMGRSIKEAYREMKGENFSPHDGWAARKAMAQLFGTQLAAAGVLGMPGVAAAMALWEQLFPDAEIKKAVAEMPSKIFGDSTFSRMIGDTVLLGAPTALSGIDVSTRLGLSNVMGVSNLDGFNPAQLAGPLGSIATNIYKASQTLQQGFTTDNILLAGQQAAPTFVKNIVKAYGDDGVIRNYSGNAVAQLTGTEQFLQAAGFRPKALSEIQNSISLAKRTEQAAQYREQNLTKELARGMIAGDGFAVLGRLSERLQAEPSYDAKAAARRAARKAVDMQLPTELGRGGTLRSATDVANMLRRTGGLPPQGASEVERLMKEFGYLGQLGIPGLQAPTMRELMNAMQVDQIRLQNPLVTADEARLQVAQQRASRRLPIVPSFGGP